MQKYADYIKEIEIESLWSGQRHVVWQLDRRVNVLSGVNGVGKSTILNKAVNVVDGKNYASAYSVSKGIQCKPASPTAFCVVSSPTWPSMCCAATGSASTPRSTCSPSCSS